MREIDRQIERERERERDRERDRGEEREMNWMKEKGAKEGQTVKYEKQKQANIKYGTNEEKK